MRPENIIEWAAERRATVVPLRHRTKTPAMAGWTVKPLTEEVLYDLLGQGPLNFGLMLGENAGNLVDVDLDSPWARLVGPMWLPRTDLVFGRSSVNQSHWVYRVTDCRNRKSWADPYPIDEDSELLLELRGTGHQTMIPPSVHPNGEQVVFARNGQPAEIGWDELVRVCNQIAVSTWITAHWYDHRGHMHDWILAFSGALLRSGVELADVEKYIRIAAELNRDTAPEMQVRTARDTAAKLHSGDDTTQTTGWPTFEKINGDKIGAKIREWLGLVQPGNPFETTDSYNASLLVKHFGNDIRYNPDSGRWYVWQGNRWLLDRKNLVVTRAQEVGEIIRRNANLIANEETKQKMWKWGTASRNLSKIRAMVDLSQAEQEIQVLAKEFDRDLLLLNLPNGTLNLTTGARQDPQREDLISQQANVVYDPRARSHLWERFIERVVPDPELRTFLQKALGYSLTGLTTEEVFFVLYGPQKNGKSTLVDTIQYLLGDYAMHANVSSFVRSGSPAPNIRQDLAEMAGRRFVATAEPNEYDRLDASIIKQITGGDPIRARFLYGREFEFHPQLKLWMSTNHLPRANGLDAAIWRRVRVLPFKVTIPEEERDRGLKEALKQPAELSGILNWMIEGLLMWRSDGLGSSQATEMETEMYRHEMDSVSAFLDDAIEFGEGPTFRVGRQTLYTAYKNYCRDTDRTPIRVDQFKQALEADPRIEVGRLRGKQIWRGLRLAGEDLFETQAVNIPTGFRN